MNRRLPSLCRSAYGASSAAVTTAMTRVPPSCTLAAESSRAKEKRAGRSSCGPRPSMRCPSLSACREESGIQRQAAR